MPQTPYTTARFVVIRDQHDCVVCATDSEMAEHYDPFDPPLAILERTDAGWSDLPQSKLDAILAEIDREDAIEARHIRDERAAYCAGVL